jgi:hypothetical protein
MLREAVAALFRVLTDLLRPRAKLIAENALLRQQVVVLKRGSARPRLKARDRWTMATITKIFPALLDAVTIVRPETVIRWHRSLWWLLWPFGSPQTRALARGQSARPASWPRGKGSPTREYPLRFT